jgi:hypothetical protein
LDLSDDSTIHSRGNPNTTVKMSKTACFDALVSSFCGAQRRRAQVSDGCGDVRGGKTCGAVITYRSPVDSS